MKKMILMSVVLIVTPAFADTENRTAYRAFSSPVNYNFAEVGIGERFSDDTDIDAVAFAAGGQEMINSNLIYNIYFSRAVVDELFYNSYVNLVSAGLANRFPVTEKLDFVLGANIIYAWNKVETYNLTITDNDFSLALNSSLRYGFTRQLEGELGFAVTNLYDSSAQELAASLTYYFNDHFGLGVALARGWSEEEDGSAYAGFVRFKF